MATFAFDFHSRHHQSYQVYLQNHRRDTPQVPLPVQEQAQEQAQARTQAQEYLRSIDDSYAHSTPLTPATGVPLLLSQQPPGQCECEPYSTSQSQCTQHQLLQPSVEAARRTSHESARRQEIGLNVQTEFAGPPNALETGTGVGVGVGGKRRKETLLRKVFPPPRPTPPL